MNPVTWFEIPVSDMYRAKTFYEFVFDLALEIHEVGFLLMAWFPMEDKGTGATGALVQAASYTPAREGVLIYFSVEDIDATLKKVNEKGGALLQPKTGIGEYGFIGYFLDSEGNRIGLHSRA
jgi:uncharacterized protein